MNEPPRGSRPPWEAEWETGRKAPQGRLTRNRIVLIGALVVGVLLYGALYLTYSGDDGTEAPEQVAAPPSPTPTPEPTPLAFPYPVPDAERYYGPTRPVTGLDSTEALTPSEVRALPPMPPSDLADWDGESVVLYDLPAGTVARLGRGSLALFNPFGRHADGELRYFAWATARWEDGVLSLDEPSDVRVMDLRTGSQESHGAGWMAYFTGPGELSIFGGPGGVGRAVDLLTGAEKQTTVEQIPSTVPVQYEGYRVDSAFTFNPAWGPAQRHLFIPDDGSTPLELTAESLLLPTSAPGSAIILTRQRSHPTLGLFRIDIATGEATLIARGSHAALPPPIASGEGLVVLTRDMCTEDAVTLVYDIEADRLTALDGGLWVTGTITDGRVPVGAGQFVEAYLDLETLEYHDVMPARAARSADGRWAAIGPGVMHADHCASFGQLPPRPVGVQGLAAMSLETPATYERVPGGGLLHVVDNPEIEVRVEAQNVEYAVVRIQLDSLEIDHADAAFDDDGVAIARLRLPQRGVTYTLATAVYLPRSSGGGSFTTLASTIEITVRD